MNKQALYILSVFILALAVGSLYWRQRGVFSPEVDSLGTAPSFNLVESGGTPFNSNQLKGNVWAVGFIFTRCQGQCPIISAQMQRVQSALKSESDFKLVSITVDPSYDSPEILSAYAKKLGSDPNRWIYLTGSPKTIHSVIVDGFHLAVEPGSSENDIVHSEKLILVDRAGNIRGYYDGIDSSSVDNLIRTAQHLSQAR